MYICFVLLNAIFIGLFEITRKHVRNRIGTPAILALTSTYTLLLGLLLIPFGVAIPLKYMPIFAFKGFILTLSQYICLKLFKTTNISLVVTLNLLSVILTLTVGLTIFGETIAFWQWIGTFLILLGITLITLLNKQESSNVKIISVVLLIATAVITTLAETIDKYTTIYLTNFQVQFWYIFYSFIFSWIAFALVCLKKKEFLIRKTDFKNVWIYLISLFLFVADIMLFLAYRSPGSQMIIISILSKIKILVTVIAGILIFKEKNVTKKILLTLLVLAGTILIAVFN